MREPRTPEEVITTTDSTPPPIVDLQEAATRNHAARRIVAGFSTAAPTLAEIWQQLQAALADTPALSAEITRLRAELADTRLDRANLLAAARAIMAAHRDGDPDPLSFLRDELGPRPAPAEPGEARMTSYRRMRRQARRVRRSGMQPMMVITGDQFPSPPGS